MKRIIKSIGLFLTTLSISLVCYIAPASAEYNFNDYFSKDKWFFNPYVGADAMFRHLPWDTGFGNDHFHENYGQGNFYLGVQIHRFIAIEGGYQNTFERKNEVTYAGPNLTALGAANFIAANVIQGHFASTSMHGGHLNLIIHSPVCFKTNIFGIIGVAWQKLKYSNLMIGFDNGDQPNMLEVVKWSSDSQAMFRLGAGIRHMITDRFGTRIFYVWEKTSRLDATSHAPFDHGALINPAAVPALVSSLTAKPKDSHSVGIGFFLHLGKV